METQEIEFFSKNQQQEVIINNIGFRFNHEEKERLKEAFLTQCLNFSKRFKIIIVIKELASNRYIVNLTLTYQESSVIMKTQSDSAYDFCYKLFDKLPSITTNLISYIEAKREELMRTESRQNPWDKPSVDIMEMAQKAYLRSRN